MTRVRPCDARVIEGRYRKAAQFLDAAHVVLGDAGDAADVGDAYVTLRVHAGIAAADVICCVELGTHSVGDRHDEAETHLERVRPDGKALGRSLGRLLSIKTRAGYQDRPVSAQDVTRAGRAAEDLVRAAAERRGRRS